MRHRSWLTVAAALWCAAYPIQTEAAVTARIDNLTQDLVITGDAADNSVMVTINSNTVAVAGLQGTKVNGVPVQIFLLANGNVRIDMKDGNDLLAVNGLNLIDLDIDLGGGHDAMALISVTSAVLTLEGGDGFDVAMFFLCWAREVSAAGFEFAF